MSNSSVVRLGNQHLRFHELGTTTDGQQIFSVEVVKAAAPAAARVRTRRPMSKRARKNISIAVRAAAAKKRTTTATASPPVRKR